MALVLIPATEASVYVDGTPSPLDRAGKLNASGLLGFGLVRPFRRDLKNDFASAGGADLVRACVGQILGMRGTSARSKGELDWDPDRGSLLYLLRHQANDLVLEQLGRAYVVEALARFEPRISIKGVRITRDAGPDGSPDAVLSIRLVYDVLAAPKPSNLVLLSGIDQTITLAQAA